MFRAAVIVVAFAALGGLAHGQAPVRDPMRPFGATAAAGGGAAAAAGGPRFALTGVLIAPSRRVAFLNGKPYVQGAVVDGAEIVAIEPGIVRLREHGADLVVSLAPRDRAQRQPAGEPVP